MNMTHADLDETVYRPQHFSVIDLNPEGFKPALPDPD